MPLWPLNGALCHIQWPGILLPADSYLIVQNCSKKERKKGRKEERREERTGKMKREKGFEGIDKVIVGAAVERRPVSDCYSSQIVQQPHAVHPSILPTPKSQFLAAP